MKERLAAVDFLLFVYVIFYEDVYFISIIFWFIAMLEDLTMKDDDVEFFDDTIVSSSL